MLRGGMVSAGSEGWRGGTASYRDAGERAFAAERGICESAQTYRRWNSFAVTPGWASGVLRCSIESQCDERPGRSAAAAAQEISGPTWLLCSEKRRGVREQRRGRTNASSLCQIASRTNSGQRTRDSTWTAANSRQTCTGCWSSEGSASSTRCVVACVQAGAGRWEGAESGAAGDLFLCNPLQISASAAN